MEKMIDGFLNNILDNISLQLNIIVGLLLLIVGILSLFTYKKKESATKGVVGWICIGLGSLGIISGILQLIFK